MASLLDLASNAQNFFINAGNNLSRGFQTFGYPQTQQAMNWINSPQQFQVPNYQVPQQVSKIPVLGGAAQTAANVGTGLLNFGLGAPINIGTDIGRTIVNPLGNQQYKSGLFKVGQDIGNTALGYNQLFHNQPVTYNPGLQKMLGDVGQLGTEALTFAGGRSTNIFKAGQTAPLWQRALAAAGNAAPTWYAYGAGQGLSQNQDKPLVQQLQNANITGLQNAAVAAAFSGAAPVVGAAIKGLKGNPLVNNEVGGGSNPLDILDAKNKITDAQLQGVGSEIPLNEKIKSEAVSGWLPGQKSAFDQALAMGDAEKVRNMLPGVPKDYQAQFADKITQALSGKGLLSQINNESGAVKIPGDNPDTTTDPFIQGLNQDSKLTAQQFNDKYPNPAVEDQLTQNSLEDANPKAAGTAVDNPQAVAEGARRARASAMESVRVRAGVVARNAQDGLKGGDNYLFRYALENPQDAQSISQLASNPQKFSDLINQYSNFTDYMAKAVNDLSPDSRMNFINDYYTHIWDLSTPEDKALYQDFLAQNGKNFTSGFTKERVLGSIQQGLDMGLRLKNENVAQDIVQYSNSMNTQIGAGAFNKAINEVRPGGALSNKKGGADVYNYQGKLFQQSNVPGNQGTFIDPEIQKYLNTYNQSAFADNPLIAGKDVSIAGHDVHIPGADQLNQLFKTSKLALGGFHGINTTLRAAISTPGSIPTAIRNSLDTGANNEFIQSAIDDGTIDYGSKVGVTYDTSGDVLPQGASFLDTLNSKNPIANFNNRLFGGLINTYKINLTRSLMDKFPDIATDPEQAAQAQAMGSQINDLMGGLNYEALGRNKTVQQAFRLVGLAPDFNEGIFRQIAQASNPKNYINSAQKPAAEFALKQVLGQAALFATIAEIGRRLTTGSFSPDVKSFISNSLIKSRIPLPNTPQFNNPTTGTSQVATLPSSEAQVLAGAIPDPVHFLQARGSALLSLASSVGSGSDYYGNSLVPKGQPDNLLTRLGAALPNQLPIPTQQIQKTLSGAQTPSDTALNIAGLKVTNDPNAPTSVFWDNYLNKLQPIYTQYQALSKSHDPGLGAFIQQHQQELNQYQQANQVAQLYAQYKKAGDTVGANNIIRQAGGAPPTPNSAPPIYTSSPDAPHNIFSGALTYGSGLLQDPSGTIGAITSGQPIRKIVNGSAILERQTNIATDTPSGGLIKDHIVPLEIGGSNSTDNIQYQTPEQAAAKDAIENQLGQLLSAGKITKTQAAQQMKDWVAQNNNGIPYSQYSANPSAFQTQTNVVKPPNAPTTLQYYFGQDPTTGSAISIPTNRPIYSPQLTGNAVMDKLELQKQAASFTTKINDIRRLYEVGQLSPEDAGNQITQLQDQQASLKQSYAAPKKTKTASVSTRAKKGTAIKVSPIKLPTLKLSRAKAPTFKLSKTPTRLTKPVKLAAYKPTKFRNSLNSGRVLV